MLRKVLLTTAEVSRPGTLLSSGQKKCPQDRKILSWGHFFWIKMLSFLNICRFIIGRYENLVFMYFIKHENFIRLIYVYLNII